MAWVEMDCPTCAQYKAEMERLRGKIGHEDVRSVLHAAVDKFEHKQPGHIHPFEDPDGLRCWVCQEERAKEAEQRAEKAEAEVERLKKENGSSAGAKRIAAERSRQVEVEGWTPDHDVQHGNNELAAAACAYLEHYVRRSWLLDEGRESAQDDYRLEDPPDIFPEWWSESWWKPKDRIRDLERAGALIAAEIDRLLRSRGAPVKGEE